MKYILLFLCILSLSCKYNVANPVGALKDYTEGSGIIYYVSSDAKENQIVDALKKNKHSLGKYKIVVSASSSSSTEILTNIKKALTNNPSFNNVEVDLSKLTNMKKITKEAFTNLKNISSITLSDAVTEIEEKAFSGCSSLNNIRFSKGLTNIGDGAFSNCVSLIFVALDSEQSLTISKDAFSGCSSLKNLVLPKSITKVDCDAFKNCNQLTNVEYLGTKENASSISSCCKPFQTNPKPSNLYLPATVTYNSSSKKYETNTISMPFLGKSDWKTNDGKHIPN